ncbi:MAG: macro domain-containing protein [Acidobacteria bacterium]|nr:macro domain-containing protein [Acidobacteriota bacterium]
MADTSSVNRPTTGVIPVHKSVVRLVKADITTLDAEAIVFYARPNLALGSGFGNAIARRGGATIKEELDQIGSVQVTGAVVTSAGTLNARFIVHAVGPVFQEPDLEQKLRATMVNALKLADDRGIAQIAFPPMGAGFYGVPLPVCAEVMLSTLTAYLSTTTGIREVIICANDTREYKAFEARLAAMTPASS